MSQQANNPGMNNPRYGNRQQTNQAGPMGWLLKPMLFNEADKNPSEPAPFAPHWDIATALVMLFGRFIPIIAPIAFAASLASKKPTPFTSGTLRTDTITFGCVLLGTILLVGALMFLPVAALGPVAEHFGPLPFGR